MTIKQLFDYVDELKPNAFSNNTKVVWLNEVEGMVQTEILLLNEKEVFEYAWEKEVSTSITIPAPNFIGIADMDAFRSFRPGGRIVNFAPGAPYTADAADSLIIKARTNSGLLVDAAFPATGDTPVTTTLTFYGGDSELLAEPPHSKIYAEYISARIDYANGEYDRYANTMQMFNTFWGEFSRWFARMYRPADKKGVQQ